MSNRQTRRPTAGGFFISTSCGVLLAAAALTAMAACDAERPADTTRETMEPTRSIANVLDEHAPRLMALEGVAGVYEGALDDGKPCIVVMMKGGTPVPRTDIPTVLEGYPVRLEFGGEIRPMR